MGLPSRLVPFGEGGGGGEGGGVWENPHPSVDRMIDMNEKIIHPLPSDAGDQSVLTNGFLDFNA